jgi:hypothetical protein
MHTCMSLGALYSEARVFFFMYMFGKQKKQKQKKKKKRLSCVSAGWLALQKGVFTRFSSRAVVISDGVCGIS